MADSSISNLPAATTPLDGTEVLPIVDGGVTQKVSVANLTAGRAISATQVTVTTGNLVIGTAGKGIDFSADNPDLIGMTSELLDDYEEGTWTGALVPLTSGSITMHAAIKVGKYTKVGNQVTITGTFQASSVSAPLGRLRISGLPFTSASGTGTDSSVGLFIQNAVSSIAVMSSIPNSGNYIDFYPFNTSSDTYAAQVQAGTMFVISATYFN